MKACVLKFRGDWDEHLPMVEFTYNNSYHASIGMPPYKALHRKKCKPPIYWDEIGDRQVLGSKLIQDATNKVKIIRQRMQVAQSHQKSYADKRCKPLEF